MPSESAPIRGIDHSIGNETTAIREPQVLHDLQHAITAPAGAELPSETSIASIPEHYGYLKETCGLDFGWGSTAFQEWVLEGIHLSTGLSWALSIVSVALLSRLVVFALATRAADQGPKMKAFNTTIEPLKKKALDAQRSGDQQALAQAQGEIRLIKKEAGVSFTAMFAPILVQVPLQFGAFRLLRNMCEIPVPALETEHWLWSTDLTLSDPYVILPVFSAAVLYYNVKVRFSDAAVLIVILKNIRQGQNPEWRRELGL